MNFSCRFAFCKGATPYACRAKMSVAEKGVKDNNGIPDSDDVFLSDKASSTLDADFAAVG